MSTQIYNPRDQFDRKLAWIDPITGKIPELLLPQISSVKIINRVLTSSEKSSGILVIDNAKSILNVILQNGDRINNTIYTNQNSSSMFLFDPITESINNVYDGALTSQSLTISYI